jgi:hypothetical protein
MFSVPFTSVDIRAMKHFDVKLFGAPCATDKVWPHVAKWHRVGGYVTIGVGRGWSCSEVAVHRKNRDVDFSQPLIE